MTDIPTAEGQQDQHDSAASSFGTGKMVSLQKLREWHTECSRWRGTWLPEAERLEGMVHAYQWTREQQEELERQGRKAIKSPHIAKVIWSMVGWRAQNKYEIKYLPRGSSDEGIATARTKLAKFIFDQNASEYVMGDACLSQYTGPLGWVFVGLDDSDPSKEPITMDVVPWREMSWDFRAKKLDLSDAKYVCRERWMSLEDAKALYPEHADQLDNFVTTRANGDQGVNEYGMAFTEQRAGDPVGPVSTWPADKYLYAARKEVRLVEIWYKVKEKGYYLQLPDGRNVVFNGNDPSHHMAVMQGGIVRPGTINCVYTATFTGDLELEHMESPYHHGMFPYVPVWGLIDQKGIPYGITRLIEDEQLVINWSTSKLLWIAASRQAFIGPTADVQDISENLAKPDGLVRRNGKDDVEIIPQADMTGLNVNLMQNALNNIKEIAGSTDETRGQDSDAKSGKAILARQSAALRQQGRFLDNEQRALVIIGQILASLMDQVYTDEKIMRITEPDGRMAQVAINVRDPLRRQQMEASGLKVYGPITQGEYDCVVSTAPLSTTELSAQFDSLTQMMGQMDPQTRLALLDVWIKAGPWENKDEIMQRVQQIQQRAFAPPQQPQEPPMKISANFADLPAPAQQTALVKEGLLQPGQPLGPADMIPPETMAKHAHDVAMAGFQHQTQQAQQAAQAQQQQQMQQQAAMQQAALAHQANQHSMMQSDQDHDEQMMQSLQGAQLQQQMQPPGGPSAQGQ